ncbi:MAG: 2-oxoglutarate and iron-dependent oxygenase domain-containing protein, partial [Vibrio metschnikovii]
MHELPTLSLAELYSNRDQFIYSLSRVAREVGFFYLSDFGVNNEKINHIHHIATDFFTLSSEEKNKVSMINSPHFRGFSGIGEEKTKGSIDIREQFDVMNEEPARQLEDSPLWMNIYGPNQWPASIPHMRELILDFMNDLSFIAQELLSAFALALEQDPDVFNHSIMGNPYQHLKLIRYPNVDLAQSSSRQGVGAHKDPGYLTLLLQDKVSGLEVLINDKWLAVPPKKDTLIVNIGELLELASDGYLKATEHRVVSPNHGQERFSIAYFMGPRLESRVPKLLLPEKLKNQALGPTSDPNNPLFYQVGDNVLKGRLRSHPEVANKYYKTIVKN